MSTNNSVNNTLSNTTVTGTANLNSGGGNITIGNSSGGALTLFQTGTWSASNNISITTGTGALNIGTSNTGGTISIGGGIGNFSSFNMNCAALSINCTNSSSDFTFTQQNTGSISIQNTGSGGSSIKYNVSAGGTGGVAMTTKPSSLSFGSSSAANNFIIGNTTGTTSVTILNGTLMNIGTASASRTISIGSSSSGSTVTFSCGTGGFILPTAAIGSSATIAPGILYIQNLSSLITLTLPSSPTIGTLYKVAGFGTGGWKIAQNASQQIVSTAHSTTAGTGGSLSSGARYDTVELIATSTTIFVIKNSTGTLTFV